MSEELKCREINDAINVIKSLKVDFDTCYIDGVNLDIEKAQEIQKDMQDKISDLSDQIDPYFHINGINLPIIRLKVGGRELDEEIQKKLEDSDLSGHIFKSLVERIIRDNVFQELQKISETVKIIRIKLSDLESLKGVLFNGNTFQINNKLGLDFCHAGVCIYQWLQDDEQSTDDLQNIVMKSKMEDVNNPVLFSINTEVGGLNIYDSQAIFKIAVSKNANLEIWLQICKKENNPK